MLLTAHSGANGSTPNAVGFFDAMKGLDVDVIEVDIRKIGKKYYLTHDRVFFPERKGLLPLSYAFEYIKEQDLKINCDLKKEGYMAYLMDLAEEMGVQDRIIITGSAADKEDLRAMRFGDLYVNPDYLPKPLPKNVPEMKKIVESMGAKGVNLSYRKTPDDFFKACADEGVSISLFTVDDENLLRKYAAFPAIVNITTRSVNAALKILQREV